MCVWEAADLQGLGTALLFRFFLFGLFFFFLDRIFLFQTENQEMLNPLEEDWCGGWMAMNLSFPELKNKLYTGSSHVSKPLWLLPVGGWVLVLQFLPVFLACTGMLCVSTGLSFWFHIQAELAGFFFIFEEFALFITFAVECRHHVLPLLSGSVCPCGLLHVCSSLPSVRKMLRALHTVLLYLPEV